MPNIIAIDPGVMNTGIVHMNERRIIDAMTIHYMHPCKTDQDMLADRCTAIWTRLLPFLVEHPHSVVVIEGFLPYRGKNTGAHQTPWLVGSLIARLEDANEAFVIQTSKQVLNPATRGSMARGNDSPAQRLKDGKFIYTGQQHLTNEHKRSAFLHGLYYLHTLGYPLP